MSWFRHILSPDGTKTNNKHHDKNATSTASTTPTIRYHVEETDDTEKGNPRFRRFGCGNDDEIVTNPNNKKIIEEPTEALRYDDPSSTWDKNNIGITSRSSSSSSSSSDGGSRRGSVRNEATAADDNNVDNGDDDCQSVEVAQQTSSTKKRRNMMMITSKSTRTAATGATSANDVILVDGVDDDDNDERRGCCSLTRSDHGWCIDRNGRREVLAKCSRNGLLLWAILVTILLIINMSISSGMFSNQNNDNNSVSAISANTGSGGTWDITTKDDAKVNISNNNNNDIGASSPVASPTSSTSTTRDSDISGEDSSNSSNNNNNNKNNTNDSGSNSNNNSNNSNGTTTDTSIAGLLCGCQACIEEIWNKPIGNPAYTCGERIEYLKDTFPARYPTQIHACRQIAFEFPCDCGSCDPGRCALQRDVFTVPNGWLPKDDYMAPPTPAPVYDPNTYQMYCYPPEGQRMSYNNVWNGGYYVEVKESIVPSICGPGNNQFVRENVVVDAATGSLTLLYKNSAASEVRILLPNDEKYTYGTYRFEIGTIAVLDSITGEVISNVLPKELVLGLFTWDDTENYAIHENYNHEVDIEISRWNCETNSDLQFLVQPPGFPQMHRMFSGGVNKDDKNNSTINELSQGDQIYEFTWNPGQIDWYSTNDNGQNFTLKTEESLYIDLPDYVQCMPDRGMQTEVRINLWNMLGNLPPSSLQNINDIVSVTITNFTFIPSTLTTVNTGGFCSKHCQCESLCDGGICM